MRLVLSSTRSQIACGHRVESGAQGDLSTGEGRLFGLIGPNGAGKSTLLDAVPGLASYDGTLELLGRDPWRARSTFLFAMLPPLALCLVEKIAIDTAVVGSLRKDRLLGFAFHDFDVHRYREAARSARAARHAGPGDRTRRRARARRRDGPVPPLSPADLNDVVIVQRVPPFANALAGMTKPG